MIDKTRIGAVMLGGVLLALAGCPKATGAGGGGGDTAAAAGKRPPLSDTMAEAPPYGAGAVIETALPCATAGSGYARFDFPVGQPVKLEIAIVGPEGACMAAAYLKANGGAVDGMMKELCVGRNATESWDVQGLEGGSFLQVNEAVPCTGATLKVTIP